MNKLTQLVFGIIVVGFLTIITFGIYKNENNLGNIFVNENAYTSASYATTTMTNSVETSLLARATSSRTMAKICHISGGTVYLYKQATSTGVINGRGNPIYPFGSSTPQTCVSYDVNDPYIGQVWGISSVTSTVSVESKQE